MLLGAALLIPALSAEAQKQAPSTAPQVRDVLPSYEGQNVASVEIAGRPDLDQQQLMPLIAQREGEPFSQAKVDQSIAALKSSGKVQEVQLEIRPQADGVRVLLVCQPAIYFGLFDFPGAAGRFPYSRLLQVSDYPPRGAYSLVDIKNAQASLATFLRQNGYFEAQVRPEVQTDTAHGLVNVIFHVNLNRHAKFGKVVLEGAPPEVAEKLQQALRSWVARVRGSDIRAGKSYSLRKIQKATQYLESRLIGYDYLGSRVQLSGAEYDPATHRAEVHFAVTPGVLAHVRVEGAHLWARTRRKLLPIYQISGLDPELIQESRENLISHFQSKGYFDVAVQSEIRSSAGGQNIIFRIIKGARHSVNEVDIVGNEKLSDAKLRGAVQVKKGSWLWFSRGAFSQRLVKKSTDNLERLYQSEGFSSVKVTPEVNKSGGNISVRFRVDEGPQDVVASLQVVGNNTVPVATLAPQGLKVSEGMAYSAKKVDEDRNQIGAQYLRLGYLNATFRATARAAEPKSHRLNVTYTISEGPKVIVDSVITLGAKVTRQSLIDKTVQLKAESPLREDDLLSAEGRLYTLGAFDWAEIDPRRPITTQTEEDVLVKLHEARQNDIRYGFGFEVVNRGGSIPSGTIALPGLPPVGLPSGFQTSQKTFWGPRVTFQYLRHNFRGLGETLTFAALGARLVQRGSASYVNPHFVGTNWGSNLTLSGERNSENPIFTSRIGDFSYQLERPLNKSATQTLSFRYDYRQTALTNLLIPDLVLPEDQHVRLSTLSGTYIRDTRDHALDAHKGMYQTVELGINPTALGSSVNFARLRAQQAYYRDVGKGMIWANSLRLGVEQEFAGSRVPVSELFFSGGGSTLRGFPLNGAGPQRSVTVCSNPANPSTCSLIQVPTGGRELFIFNSEMRIPLPIKKGLGLVAFYDGGNVFEHVGFRDFGSNYSNSVGIGLRYATPIGPVRVDLGHNLNALPGVKATQIFITLGQAF
ncbi:MAG TPA: POTRA domain-containing protein [Terriglobales bacterium]|jgi:outer membrane protein assembly factor BamA|nr:POTRA domain-containing protein [Terriglobales bacterium]